MPERIWTYECCAVTAGATACPTCGRPGEFAGWGLTASEAMERHWRAFGFEPVGPHLQLVERHLLSLRPAPEQAPVTPWDNPAGK
jgi:hypothetical protein